MPVVLPIDQGGVGKMNKSKSVNPNPRSKVASAKDDVGERGDKLTPAPPVAEKVPMKRLTFDIAADLHKRIRLACVQNDVDMATAIRRLLAEHFPEQ